MSLKPKFTTPCNGSHLAPKAITKRGDRRQSKQSPQTVGPKARGICQSCETEQQINDNGTTAQHNVPFDPKTHPAVILCPPDLWAQLINLANMRGIANPSDLAIETLRETLRIPITKPTTR